MVGIGWDRVKVSENLGATSVAPVDTSLVSYLVKMKYEILMSCQLFLMKVIILVDCDFK